MSINLQINLEQQITQLEKELAAQQSDIQNLQDALTTLEANKPRPINPSADGAFEMLKELVGTVPKSLEEGQLYQTKLQEPRRALQLAISSAQQKRQRLNALRQQQQGQQQEAAFEQLKSKATAFNQLIDGAMAHLEEMRSLPRLAGAGKLEITVDLNELPYSQLTASSVKVRRVFDVKRG